MRLVSLLALAAVLTTAGCDSGQPDTCGGGTEVQKTDVVVGTGSATATVNSTVTVRYVGTLENGSEFDSNEAATFSLARTIAGFRQGVAGMKIGGRRTITIPPNLAYGPVEQEDIPSCSTLIFDVTLLDVR